MAAYLDYVGGGGSPGGHYRLSLITGLTTGLTAGQAIFCWRWTDTMHYLALLGCQVSAGINTAFGTAQISDIALFINRGWSTAPSGGTTVQPIGASMNMMADQGGTAMAALTGLAGTIQVATTGALTTGTRTQDGNPIGYGVFNAIALGSADRCSLYDLNYGNDYPLRIGAQEGIEIDVPTAQGATGKVVYYINLKFAIVPGAY